MMAKILLTTLPAFFGKAIQLLNRVDSSDVKPLVATSMTKPTQTSTELTSMKAEIVSFVAMTGWLTKLSWSDSEEYVGGFFSILLSVIFGFLCLVGISLFFADSMNVEDTPRTVSNPRTRRDQRAAAPRAGGLGNQRIDALHSSVLGAFYHRKKGV